MKVFNKQRFGFMSGKNFKKYFKYAFGEIILVVIGILIAVGINNWNQQRQLDHKNTELAKQVTIELKKNITTISSYKKKIDTIQQRFLKILGKKYDQTMVRQNDFVGSLLFEPNIMDLDNTVINLIDNADLNESETSKVLLNLSSSYKSHIDLIKQLESLIFTKINDNLKEIEKTEEWYIDLLTDYSCQNECIEFLLHNKAHKSRMASLRFIEVDVYGQSLYTMRMSLQKYLDDLE